MKQPLWPFIAVAVIMMALLGYVIARSLTPPEPPLDYTQDEYTPERAALWSGATLVYTPTLTINRSGRVDIVRSFWDIGRNQAAQLCDGTVVPAIETRRALPASLHGAARDQAVRVFIPNLRPGAYWLVTSATNPGGGEALTQVRFRVVSPCADRQRGDE